MFMILTTAVILYFYFRKEPVIEATGICLLISFCLYDATCY